MNDSLFLWVKKESLNRGGYKVIVQHVHKKKCHQCGFHCQVFFSLLFLGQRADIKWKKCQKDKEAECERKNVFEKREKIENKSDFQNETQLSRRTANRFTGSWIALTESTILQFGGDSGHSAVKTREAGSAPVIGVLIELASYGLGHWRLPKAVNVNEKSARPWAFSHLSCLRWKSNSQ